MVHLARVFQDGHDDWAQRLEADDRERLVQQVAQLSVSLAALLLADVVDLLNQLVAQTLQDVQSGRQRRTAIQLDHRRQ